MAKITNPLHSLTASGSVAALITYRHTAARAIAHRLPAASKSATAAQLARRALYAAGCAAWQALTPEEKAAWAATGEVVNLSGFSLYIKTYLLTPPAAGTIWDGGATTWDGGATTWDA